MSEKCGCEFCYGTRGGVPGNENILRGKKICDYCHADLTQFKHTDMFGREIKVGDYIVYGAVDGRSGTLRAGQVVELKKPSICFRGKVEGKIQVKSWSNFRSQGWNGEEKSGRQKNVTLSFLDRLVVVDPNMVSDKIKKDLAGGIADYAGNIIDDSRESN